MSSVDSPSGADRPREMSPRRDGESGSLSTLSIWSEKIDGKGEDGPPLILLSGDYSFGAIAVSDGVGGAGSRQLSLDGELASGARLAAGKLLEVVLAFFKGVWLEDSLSGDAKKPNSSHMKQNQPAMRLEPYLPAKVGNCLAYRLKGAVCGVNVGRQIELLSKSIDDAFEKINRKVTDKQPPSGLKTKMQRNLPSTLAGWVYRTTPEKEITAFWAGDSRCYVLSEEGLRQITRDEAKGDFDAFEAIRADPPLTNYISERIPNSLKHKCLLNEDRALLICATDGAFNYQPTPMAFEFVVLSSLMSSESMQTWVNDLAERLQASAGDDVSMVVHPLGFESFNSLKAFYKKRFNDVTERFVQPLETLHEKQVRLEEELARVKAATKEKTKEVWNQYRVTYEQYLDKGESG